MESTTFTTITNTTEQAADTSALEQALPARIAGRLTVHTGRPYEVLILEPGASGAFGAIGSGAAEPGPGIPSPRPDAAALCADLAARIKEGFGTDRRYCLITDANVSHLYGDAMSNALSAAGLDAFRLVLPAGESTKSIRFFSLGLETLARERMSRGDVIIAFGGGVIGDLAGFIASSYMRGIEFIQIPTTLLSCVDSSVGGKTAIDLASGKNLAGAFWQPSAVFIQEGFLHTLTDHQLLDGLAEIIKCGVIGDPELFAVIENAFADFPQTAGADTDPADPAAPTPLKNLILDPSLLSRLITDSVALKRKVVEADETEKGQRQLLNLGHTIGHGVEAASAFTETPITHGHAVAIGLSAIAKVSAKRGWCDAEPADRITALLSKAGFPLDLPEDPMDLRRVLGFMTSDKKRRGDSLTFIIPEEIGACVTRSVSTKDLPGILSDAV